MRMSSSSGGRRGGLWVDGREVGKLEWVDGAVSVLIL